MEWIKVKVKVGNESDKAGFKVGTRLGSRLGSRLEQGLVWDKAGVKSKLGV